MSSKLALVVDDSRMARYVLSKMLSEQGINVDSVESGEEALGYLCDKKPSMIFMDHTMPGMDGFQCLRAIKNDPRTAMIPIIMYTSKEGEVYESQARALGAVDVLPKTLKPLMLTQVLERQNLLPEQQGNRSVSTPAQAANDVIIVDNESEENAVAATPPVASPSVNEQHEKELETLEQRIELLTTQLTTMGQEQNESRNKSARFQFLGLALCVVLIGWLLLNNNKLMQNITQLQVEKRELTDSLGMQTQQNDAIKNELKAEMDNQFNQSQLHSRRFFESIEWALNEDGQFAWNEQPFNDRLAATLSQLAENLRSVDFVGEISIRSHLGRFCYETLETGEPALPEPGQQLSTCEIAQFTADAAEIQGTAQSPGFERFISAFDAEYGDDIEIKLSTAADRRPLARYPTADPDMLVERWNSIAARNQRIEIAINPY